ncbi:hypothetical protein GH714_022641 [Hevea brasiliensis]|uniref:Uncharacterized protein n=1 Tax=Hevea brasiliensis TaxID=3981 RepID=A0A6A6NIQ6_HEVBR|nr:hypothetical protein GH714_022641 [Hevea brasiliensis]
MMDRLVSREREPEVDLESGGTTSEEDGTNDLVSANKQTKKVLNSVWSGPLGFDGLGNSSKFGEDADENVEFLLDKNSEGKEGQQQIPFVNKKLLEEKKKKKNSRQAPKPPRPPKGPSLDAADQKLVQEITELAMRKRARIERIRVLKKMRAAKSSSWNSSLYAMAFTVLFFLVLIFQEDKHAIPCQCKCMNQLAESVNLQLNGGFGIKAQEEQNKQQVLCLIPNPLTHCSPQLVEFYEATVQEFAPETLEACVCKGHLSQQLLQVKLISVQFYKNAAYEGDGPGSGSPRRDPSMKYEFFSLKSQGQANEMWRMLFLSNSFSLVETFRYLLVPNQAIAIAA